MKIKGIDLLKKALELDEDVLNKRFYNEKYGNMTAEYGGLFIEEAGNNYNIFTADYTPQHICNILTEEWKKQALWQEVSWQKAIEEHCKYDKVVRFHGINGTKFVSKIYDYEDIYIQPYMLHGKWYILD